jgi:hypothetical protein
VLQYISVPVVTMFLDEMIDTDQLSLIERDQVASRPIEEEVEWNYICATVRHFVMSLPPQDRTMVESIFWLDASQAEVARSLGLSRMAITKRMKKIYRLGLSALATFGPQVAPVSGEVKTA